MSGSNIICNNPSSSLIDVGTHTIRNNNLLNIKLKVRDETWSSTNDLIIQIVYIYIYIWKKQINKVFMTLRNKKMFV